MKECTKCKITKPLEEFNWRNKKKLIKQPACKVCTRAEGKKHYQANKTDVVNKVRTRNKHYQHSGYRWKSNLMCCNCGEDRYYCLDFHHIDENQKDIDVSKLMSRGSIAKLMHEIKKCIIVCSNCHRAIHHGDVVVTDDMINNSQKQFENNSLDYSYQSPLS